MAATVYHISSSGTEDGDGSSGSPWPSFEKACGFAAVSGDTLILDGVGPVDLSTASCSLTFASVTCAAAGGAKCGVSVSQAASLVFPVADSSTAVVQDLAFTYADATTADTANLIQTSRDLNVQNVDVNGIKTLLDVKAGATVALSTVSVGNGGISIAVPASMISLAATTTLSLNNVSFSGFRIDAPIIDASLGSNTNVTVVNSAFSSLNSASNVGNTSPAAILYAVQASTVSFAGTTFANVQASTANSLIAVVDSATATGVSSSSITSELSITDSTFTSNSVVRTGSLLKFSGVANFEVSGNTFTSNSAAGCAVLQLTQSSGTISDNEIANTTIAGAVFETSATVCVDQDYSAVNSAVSSSAAMINFTSNAWLGVSYTQLAASNGLLLELMSSKSYPLASSAISAHKANVSLSANQWSSNSGPTPAWQTSMQTIPSVFFNQSTVTINEDTTGSQTADINGITEVASYITLQANVSTTLLGAYGANSFRLSRYILNGFALIARNYPTYTGSHANSAITGGSFESGTLLIETPTFVCCGYIPQPHFPISEEFDKLIFTNVNVAINGQVALVRTTNAVVLTSSTMTVGALGLLLAPRPISPRLVTGTQPATINGSVTVQGTLRAVDLAINGDLIAPAGSSIQVVPTSFRDVAHGLKISGTATIAQDSNGNYVSLVSDEDGPSQFGSSSDFIGQAYPPSLRINANLESGLPQSSAWVFQNPSWATPLFNEIDTNTLRFVQVAGEAIPQRKRNEINDVSAVATGAYATQTFDLSGRAIYVKAPVPVRANFVGLSPSCADFVTSVEYGDLACSWIDDYTIMVSGNKLPETNCLILSSPFLIDESCSIDASNLRAPLASIVPVPSPFIDSQELVLDASTSLFLGPDPQKTIYVWTVSSTDVTIDASLTSFLATTSASIVRVPTSLLQNSGVYNFSVVVSNNFFDSDPAILSVNYAMECADLSLYFERSLYEVYNNEFSTIVSRFDTRCVDTGFEALDSATYTWVISAEEEAFEIGGHHEAILTYQFLPILNDSNQSSGFALSNGLAFDKPYKLTATATRNGGRAILSASTTLILRYHFEVVAEGMSFSNANREVINFNLNLEDKIDLAGSVSGSIPIYRPILYEAKAYVLSCPTDVAAELNMPFGDTKPAIPPTSGSSSDLCPHADRSQGWYEVSFSVNQNGATGFYITIPVNEDMDYGQYIFGIDYRIITNANAWEVRGSTTFTTTLGVTEGGAFGSQISSLPVSSDWDALWYSPSKRVVLQVGFEIEQDCSNCIYQWSFPNGELSDAYGPYLSIPPGSIPAGANTTVVVYTSDGLLDPQVALRDDFPSDGSFASYNLVMGQKPFGGFFNVTPSSGTAFETKFSFLTQSWESHFPSLSYYYTVVNPLGEWVLGIPAANGTGLNVTIPFWDTLGEEVLKKRLAVLGPTTVVLRVIDASGSTSSTTFGMDISAPSQNPANQYDALTDLLNEVSNAALYDNDLNRLIVLANELAFVAAAADPGWLTQHHTDIPQRRADDYFTYGRQIADALAISLGFIADYPPRSTISPALAHAMVQTIRNCAQFILLSDDVDGLLHDAILRSSVAVLASMSYVPLSSHYDDLSASILENFFFITNETAPYDASNRQYSVADLVAELGLSIFPSLYGSDSEKFAFSSVSFEARQFAYTASQAQTFALSADTSTVTTISTTNDLSGVASAKNTFRAAVTVAENNPLLPSTAQFRRAVTLSLPFSSAARRDAKALAADYEPVRRTKSLLRRAMYSAQSLYYGYDVEGEYINEQIQLKRAAAYDARRDVLASAITFTSNFTIPLTTSKGSPSCSVFSPGSNKWDPSTCTTKTGSNGVVTCTCRASQTQTTLSVLFGTLGDKKGISKGGIAAAVIFPLIIAAVIAVVLVNLFIPALACGPFKRYHNQGKELNALQMTDTGARAGPPRNAAPASSSATAPLVSPTPVTANTYSAPIAPEHAPTPDPAPSSGWAKSSPSEVV